MPHVNLCGSWPGMIPPNSTLFFWIMRTKDGLQKPPEGTSPESNIKKINQNRSIEDPKLFELFVIIGNGRIIGHCLDYGWNSVFELGKKNGLCRKTNCQSRLEASRFLWVKKLKDAMAKNRSSGSPMAALRFRISEAIRLRMKILDNAWTDKISQNAGAYQGWMKPVNQSFQIPASNRLAWITKCGWGRSLQTRRNSTRISFHFHFRWFWEFMQGVYEWQD